MAFMEPQYLEGIWFDIDGDCGITSVFADDVGHNTTVLADYYEGKIESVEKRRGVGARLSAPGFMDCTEWAVYPTLEEARAGIEETYDVDPDTGDDLPE